MWAEAWRGHRRRRHPRASKRLLGGMSLALAEEARCRQGSLSCDAPCGQPASRLEVRGANHDPLWEPGSRWEPGCLEDVAGRSLCRCTGRGQRAQRRNRLAGAVAQV